jgi:hypothetical protein
MLRKELSKPQATQIVTRAATLIQRFHKIFFFQVKCLFNTAADFMEKVGVTLAEGELSLGIRLG